ncbi:hypothetical protein D3C73_1413210 [compost metagenome]
MVVPAKARARRPTRSVPVMAERPDMSISTPPVWTKGEDECPEPTARTGKPSRMAKRTASSASCSFLGRTVKAGVALWFPPQLVQVTSVPKGAVGVVAAGMPDARETRVVMVKAPLLV